MFGWMGPEATQGVEVSLSTLDSKFTPVTLVKFETMFVLVDEWNPTLVGMEADATELVVEFIQEAESEDMYLEVYVSNANQMAISAGLFLIDGFRDAYDWLPCEK